ncbi:MAG: alkaline phosphatase family protein [Bacteroidetes bacterium]|nr:alkaline phosphatase family protein [Bacteroidota bacterium]
MSKVLLIGWDAADWKVINPLMDEGLMPALQSLVEGGVKGKMATLDPPLSPMLWTSIATGKRPYKHGIHGFTEPDPSGKGIRPIYNTSRKCKAIWNILTQHGLKTHVVGWWPSHPAEPVNGNMISNFYQRAEMRPGQPWNLVKGTVHPAEKADFFAKLRVHPHELTGNHIQPFVPGFEKIDQKKDRRLTSIAKVIADCSTIHSAATYILENEEWDFMAVYYDAIDHFCHGFMKYHPPRREHVSMQDFELYKDVVASGYRFHDMMLARLLQLAGDDTTVMLISDHGFHPDHNRPKSIPKEPAGPAIEHSPFGIIAMQGPGIKKDELLFGASLLDVMPTLLTLFGLPVAEDMDGKVLVQAFESEPEIQTIQSWENMEGFRMSDFGCRISSIEQSDEDMQAELQQLIDLGYIADPGGDLGKAVKETLDENNFNLARAYLDGQQWDEGIRLLEKLHGENPSVLRFATYLANACQNVGKFKKARQVVNHIRDTFDRENPQLDVLEGTLLLAEERPLKALALFQKVEKEAGGQPHLRQRVANAYLQMNKLAEAEAVLEAAILQDPEEVGAWYALGVCRYRMTRHEEAAAAFLQAIGLMYYQPAAHFYLGETLLAMQRYEDAANAFDVCLRLAPGMNIARERLISIYSQFLEQPGKANKYRLDFEKNIRGEIVVVSGLPRSGTSMMMQMLEAGGMAVFTDRERQADESNLRGYYEHEAVKNLAKNKSWLPQASGKAVKVIAHLLPHLPVNWRYKVIFMERDVLEVVRSQQKMLARKGSPLRGKAVREDTLPLHLVKSYEQTLEKVKAWAQEKPNVEVFYQPYSEAVESPFLAAMRVNDFLGGQLQPEAMAGAVEARLWRERSEIV